MSTYIVTVTLLKICFSVCSVDCRLKLAVSVVVFKWKSVLCCMNKTLILEQFWIVVPVANIPGFAQTLGQPNGLKNWIEPQVEKNFRMRHVHQQSLDDAGSWYNIMISKWIKKIGQIWNVSTFTKYFGIIMNKTINCDIVKDLLCGPLFNLFQI